MADHDDKLESGVFYYVKLASYLKGKDEIRVDLKVDDNEISVLIPKDEFKGKDYIEIKGAFGRPKGEFP